jgi:hypothetical protein
MSSVFSIFCGTTFSSIFHFFKKQYQCLQELTKHYSNATVEEKFKLSDEPVGEPPLYLEKALKEANLDKNKFLIMKFGETLSFR